jgi:hypothetical protein
MPPIESATDLVNRARLGETTYQVMVGNRMTGETRPARTPKRLALVPYIGEALSGVFGASQEVENQATNDAWKESHWMYPQPARTPAAAATAARWAFLEAAKESPEPGANQGSGYFTALASSAAYTYDRQGETPTSILNRVLSRLAKAPYTASKIRKILSLSAPVAAAPAAKKRRRSTSAPAQDYETLPEVAPPTAWEQIAAGLPPWAPTAAGVVAVGLAVITFWPKPRAA